MKPRTYITLLSTFAMLVGLYLGLHPISLESPMNQTLGTTEAVDCGPAIHPDLHDARIEDSRLGVYRVFDRAPSNTAGLSMVAQCEEAGSLERILFWLLLALGAAGVIGAQFVRPSRPATQTRMPC